MADVRGKQLPNLKISVDNTESTDESDDEVEVQEENEVAIQEEEELSELSEDEGEIDRDDDVEFNVRIGNFSDPKPKKQTETVEKNKNTASSTSPEKPESAKENLAGSVERRLPQVPEKRVYENKHGSFVTGIDVTSKEAQEKRDERAKRFKIQISEEEKSTLDIQALYASIGLTESDSQDASKGLRMEAVHLHGTDEMSTKDIFEYFTQFPASGVEWINDSSCNVVWTDKVTSVRALLKLSLSYDDAVAAQAKKKEAEQEKKKLKKKEPKPEGVVDGGAGDADTTKAEKTADKTKKASADGGKEEEEEEEKMEVDDDDLDLMGEDNTASAPKDKPDADGDADGKGKADPSSAEPEKGGSADKKKATEKKSKEKKQDADKKGKERKKKKKGEEGGGADSDSSSSSSSRSSSGSSTGSSGSSSSGSDSSSSSGSDSDSSSNSSSESGSEKGKKKKLLSKSKRDADTGELVPNKRGGSQQKKQTSIPWPPGKWRLGIPCKKARFLFMRFARQDDQKEKGAERKSQYYRKYGNPNYGGMKGLISNSWKRKIRMAKLDKELKSQGPDARETIDRKRADRQHQPEDADREDGELSNEDGDSQEEEKGESMESEEEVQVIEKPQDLRQLLNRDSGAQVRLREDSSLDKVVVKKRQRDDEEDEMDLDAELEHLLERPAKKRLMMMGRMHADEEEERIKAQRARTGLLTVVASDKSGLGQSRLAGRLGGRLGRLQAPLDKEARSHSQTLPRREAGLRREAEPVWASEGRLPNSEDDEEEEEEEEEEEMNDFAKELETYRTLRNLPPAPKTKVAASSKQKSSTSSQELTSRTAVERGGGGGGERVDLRSRLGVAKRTGDSEKRSFPSMRIEVLDDDDDDE